MAMGTALAYQRAIATTCTVQGNNSYRKGTHMRHFESFETFAEADEHVRSAMTAFRNSPDFECMSDQAFHAVNDILHGSMAVIRLATIEIGKYKMLLAQRDK